MKKIFFAAIAILLTQVSLAQSPQFLNDYVFKSGDIFEYEINKGGKTYTLIFTLTGHTFIDGKIVDTITFDWKIAGDTSRKGSVTISRQARDNANNYQAELLNGASTFTNKSSFWLSLMDKDMLFSRDGRSLDVGDGKKQVYKVIEGASERYNIQFKGKPAYFESFRTKSASGNSFTFYGSMNSNSLLLYVNAGWTIRLKEIR